MIFPKINNWKLYYFTISLFVLLICIPFETLAQNNKSNDASASPPVNKTSEFLPEYKLDKFKENFSGQRNDNISNEKNKNQKPLQRPILLIPGHDMELMDKCSSAQMKLTKAKKQLQRAQDDYEKELRIRRNLYRTENNRVIDLKKLLEQLFQEQNKLEKMDNSGTTKARIDAAKEQGKIDITSAIGKLNFQQKKANKAKLDLVRFKRPDSKKRMAINKLEKQLQLKIKLLNKCLKSKEKTTAPEVNTKPEQQPDRANNSRIPDIPEDLPVDEPVKKQNNKLDNPQSDKSIANMNLLFPRVPFIADMNVEGAKSKIYRDGNKTRYETSASLASIILLDQSIIWQMFFDLGVYVTMPLPQKHPPTIIKQEMLGKEVVNGYKVTKYHIIQGGVDGYYADGLYWITPEGITVKSQAREIVNGKARTSRFELSNIVIGPIDPSKFKVPKRLKLTKFPLQMGK